jgi:hypothetical protein
MTHTSLSYFFTIYFYLGDKNASTSSSLDLLLGELGEKLGLHNYRNGNLSISKELEISLGNKVNNRCLSSPVLGSFVYSLSSDIEDLINVDSGAEVTVLQNVKVAHTDLTKVTRVVLIKEGTVVVLSSRITASTRMLAVLSDTTVTGRDVSSLLSVLAKAGRHLDLIYIVQAKD